MCVQSKIDTLVLHFSKVQNGGIDREYTTIDKSTWGPGPWQSEPDKLQWVDKETQFDCLIVRNGEIGNLCGYVGTTTGGTVSVAGGSSGDEAGPDRLPVSLRMTE